jgi:hypothetical protein
MMVCPGSTLSQKIIVAVGFLFLIGFIMPAMALPPEVEADEKRLARFKDNGDGTVTDAQTGLMWAARDNGHDINWADAKAYCRNYSGGGHTDWRMPTQDELAGLYDKEEPGSNHITPLIKLSGCCPWAIETRGSEAAHFSYGAGYRYWGSQSGTLSDRALPVRSGK